MRQKEVWAQKSGDNALRSHRNGVILHVVSVKKHLGSTATTRPLRAKSHRLQRKPQRAGPDVPQH
ncbi:MAG: hypothetical protein SOY69_01605, partial [Alloprevotella sp.]|nr:hypothetical protein [Alloprevotella sp.]